MRTRGKVGIGVALILVVASGAYWGFRAHQREAQFAWSPQVHGRSKFAMIVNANAWNSLTAHRGGGWTNELLDAKVHARINALVERGMRGERGSCPGRWLMSRIQPLPDGSIYFSGFCARADELQPANGDQFAKVST